MSDPCRTSNRPTSSAAPFSARFNCAVRGAQAPRRAVQRCEKQVSESATRLLRTAADISGDALKVGYHCGSAHERAYCDGKTSVLQRRLAAPAVFAGVFVQRSCQLAVDRVVRAGPHLARDAVIATAGGAAAWALGATRALTVVSALGALVGMAGLVDEAQNDSEETVPAC